MFTKNDIEKYFNAEKAESLLFIGIGVAAVIAALVCMLWFRTAFSKGAAIPLALVGLLLGVVGYTVYARSDADRIRNVYAYDMNPAELRTTEIPRMQTVMRNFVVYRYAEIALAVVGFLLLLWFRNRADMQLWAGLGTGLLIMALLALTADYLAEHRGHAVSYTHLTLPTIYSV